MGSDWRWFALLSAFFAGLTALFGKLGVAHIDSTLATFLRTAVILVITAIAALASGAWKMPQELSRSGLVFLFLSGVATGLSWLAYYRALQLGPASKVAPIDKMSVVFAIVLAVVFLKEELTIKTVVGAVLVVVGSLVIAM